jgi:hypothetical protein
MAETKPEPPFLAEARAELAAHFAANPDSAAYYATRSPADQEADLQSRP